MAVSEADKQVTSALIAGKDVSDAIWKISAAKSALASKDYEIALQLAKEASQLASEAKIRQDITIPTLSIPAVPDDAKPTVVAGGGLMVVGGAVLAIAVVITAYLFFIRKTKHS